MPFAGYKNFNACVKANKGKKNAEAYCASIMTAVEDVKPTYEINSKIRNYGDTSIQGHVRVNPKKGDVVNTIIHEQIHNADWNMDHEKVYENAKKIEGQMTLPEQAALLMKFHDMAMNSPKRREIKHTIASKIISQTIK
jgi:hypothetical protein